MNSQNVTNDSSQEQLLRDIWEETRLPLLDDRAEVVAWYEERQQQARSALIEYRKQHEDNWRKRYQIATMWRLLRRCFGISSQNKTPIG